jgi:hypothetical protein
MLRSRKDWGPEVREYAVTDGWGQQGRKRIRITLHESGLTDSSEPWLKTLSARERAELFEEVEV